SSLRYSTMVSVPGRLISLQRAGGRKLTPAVLLSKRAPSSAVVTSASGRFAKPGTGFGSGESVLLGVVAGPWAAPPPVRAGRDAGAAAGCANTVAPGHRLAMSNVRIIMRVVMGDASKNLVESSWMRVLPESFTRALDRRAAGGVDVLPWRQ